MGAENTKKEKNYYTIREHLFVKSVKDPTEKSKPREHEGKTYHEEHFNTINGYMVGMFVWDEPNEKGRPYQKMAVNLYDRDTKEYEAVQMYFGGNASETFLNRLFKIDLKKDIKIKIMKQEKKNDPGKFKDLICVYQKGEDGKPVLIAGTFSKEVSVCDFGTYPEMERTGVEGNYKYDSSKRFHWWETEIIPVFNAKIKAALEEIAAAQKNVNPHAEEMEKMVEVQRAEAEEKHREVEETLKKKTTAKK